MFSTFISAEQKFNVTFTPLLDETSKVIMPFSVTRYMKNKHSKVAYDEEISAVLEATARMIKEKRIQSADILVTGQLHEDIPEKQVEELDSHFLRTHEHQFAQFSGVYRLKEFQEKKIDSAILANNMQLIEKDSAEGSPWYEAMAKMCFQVKKSLQPSILDDSLRYQRRECALTKSMGGIYTHKCYMGFIPDAMAFLYRQYPTCEIPLFVHVGVTHSKEEIIKSTEAFTIFMAQMLQQAAAANADASFLRRVITRILEDALTTNKMPHEEKEKLQSICTNLIHAYGGSRITFANTSSESSFSRFFSSSVLEPTIDSNRESSNPIKHTPLRLKAK